MAMVIDRIVGMAIWMPPMSNTNRFYPLMVWVMLDGEHDKNFNHDAYGN
jgi:hypothetical protein